VLAYSDAGMPALALGYSIGRIGCFLNGDDYGTLTNVPWAVVYPPSTPAYSDHMARGWINSGAPSSLPIHPVQLYASALGLGLFLLLALWRPRKVGSRFCAFLIVYGIARFCFEQWFRGDFRAVVGPFSLPQAFSVLFDDGGSDLGGHVPDQAEGSKVQRELCIGRNGGSGTNLRRRRVTSLLTDRV
jgi:phosphatidylglycerol:prolipoprotein diacylglycerol transferase